jgi:hypothetical protein
MLDRFLERLLGYCLRGAIKQERLAYDGTRVTYRLEKGKRRGLTLEWSGEEFVHRWGRLIPPPRQHLVTYGGVLGPAIGTAWEGYSGGSGRAEL